MKSGMLAAEAAFDALSHGRQRDTLDAYDESYRTSSIRKDLLGVRNAKPMLTRFGTFWGEVVGIHFRDQQRDVVGHPERRRITDHEDAGRSEERLDRIRNGGVECREREADRHGWGGRRELQVGDLGRQGVAFAPAHRVAIPQANPLGAGGHLDHFEPRVVSEQGDEFLADGAGGTEHSDGNALHGEKLI
jgi:hypothetical protein